MAEGFVTLRHLQTDIFTELLELDFTKAKGKTVESKTVLRSHFPSTLPVLILALISLVHIVSPFKLPQNVNTPSELKPSITSYSIQIKFCT